MKTIEQDDIQYRKQTTSPAIENHFLFVELTDRIYGQTKTGIHDKEYVYTGWMQRSHIIYYIMVNILLKQWHVSPLLNVWLMYGNYQ